MWLLAWEVVRNAGWMDSRVAPGCLDAARGVGPGAYDEWGRIRMGCCLCFIDCFLDLYMIYISFD